jgi:hypothetical protein
MTNAMVQGGYPDGGTYVVDVAVLSGEAVHGAKALGKAFAGFTNDKLLTFVEAKALKVHPMLLAQFVGIVLEVKPQFVTGRRPRFHRTRGHFDPTLVALGSYSANAQTIVKRYPRRGIRVNVVTTFDAKAARGDLDEPARELTPALP